MMEKKKTKYGLTKSGRVDEECEAFESLMKLAESGCLYATTIARATGLSLSQIYYRLKTREIHLRKIREGKEGRGKELFYAYRITRRKA